MRAVSATRRCRRCLCAAPVLSPRTQARMGCRRRVQAAEDRADPRRARRTHERSGGIEHSASQRGSTGLLTMRRGAQAWPECRDASPRAAARYRVGARCSLLQRVEQSANEVYVLRQRTSTLYCVTLSVYRNQNNWENTGTGERSISCVIPCKKTCEIGARPEVRGRQRAGSSSCRLEPGELRR
jgi:hypothetical protein